MELLFQSRTRPARQQELHAQRARLAAQEAAARAEAEQAEHERQREDGQRYLQQVLAQLQEQLAPARDEELSALVRAARSIADVEALCALEIRAARLGQRLSGAAEPGEEQLAWEQSRKEALVAQGALLGRVAGLHADEAARTWCGARLQAAHAVLDRIQEHIAAERWGEVTLLARNALRLADAIVDQAQQRQLQEETRASLLRAFLELLSDEGLEPEVPELGTPGDLDSEVLLRCQGPEGASLRVRVSAAGLVAVSGSYSEAALRLLWGRVQRGLAEGFGFELISREA